MSLTFTNARIVTPFGIVEGSLSCSDGLITAIGSDEAITSDRTVDVAGGYLLPGFIDTQVNGGGGVLLNDSPSIETIAAIGKAHRRYGTTAYLPTLISDKLSIIDDAMRATEAAIAAGVPGVLGLHIEGPFISKTRKGIHNSDMFRSLDPDSKALLKSLKLGRTVVTLAPENCSPEDISELRDAGVIVAAGHTNATYEVATQAFAAGITGVTHLFNAMSPMLHRSPGVVGSALDNQNAYCGIIADGNHVDWPVLRVALRARPIDRFMLVTDAMPTVGNTRTTFKLNGNTILVENGVCIDENGTLAGSNLDMATAVRNSIRNLGVTIADAAIMASTAPAKFLDLGDERGALLVGHRADIVWMSSDLDVIDIFIGGAGMTDG